MCTHQLTNERKNSETIQMKDDVIWSNAFNIKGLEPVNGEQVNTCLGWKRWQNRRRLKDMGFAEQQFGSIQDTRCCAPSTPSLFQKIPITQHPANKYTVPISSLFPAPGSTNLDSVLMRLPTPDDSLTTYGLCIWLFPITPTLLEILPFCAITASFLFYAQIVSHYTDTHCGHPLAVSTVLWTSVGRPRLRMWLRVQHFPSMYKGWSSSYKSFNSFSPRLGMVALTFNPTLVGKGSGISMSSKPTGSTYWDPVSRQINNIFKSLVQECGTHLKSPKSSSTGTGRLTEVSLSYIASSRPARALPDRLKPKSQPNQISFLRRELLLHNNSRIDRIIRDLASKVTK